MADSINITLSGTPSAEPFLPTATQKAALAGTGTPSSGNKFVTKDTLDAETSERTSADSTLQANIDSEATARASADNTLQTNITSEASTRASADTALQTNITNEATARSEADTALGNAKVDKVTGKGLSTNDFDNTYKAYHDKLAATHDIDGKQKPSGMAAQTKTVITTLNPTPDYLGQVGIDSSGKKYIAISLTGTMWQKMDEGTGVFMKGVKLDNPGGVYTITNSLIDAVKSVKIIMLDNTYALKNDSIALDTLKINGDKLLLVLRWKVNGSWLNGSDIRFLMYGNSVNTVPSTGTIMAYWGPTTNFKRIEMVVDMAKIAATPLSGVDNPDLAIIENYEDYYSIKNKIALENVDNTSDVSKPLSDLSKNTADSIFFQDAYFVSAAITKGITRGIKKITFTKEVTGKKFIVMLCYKDGANLILRLDEKVSGSYTTIIWSGKTWVAGSSDYIWTNTAYGDVTVTIDTSVMETNGYLASTPVSPDLCIIKNFQTVYQVAYFETKEKMLTGVSKAKFQFAGALPFMLNSTALTGGKYTKDNFTPMWNAYRLREDPKIESLIINPPEVPGHNNNMALLADIGKNDVMYFYGFGDKRGRIYKSVDDGVTLTEIINFNTSLSLANLPAIWAVKELSNGELLVNITIGSDVAGLTENHTYGLISSNCQTVWNWVLTGADQQWQMTYYKEVTSGAISYEVYGRCLPGWGLDTYKNYVVISEYANLTGTSTDPEKIAGYKVTGKIWLSTDYGKHFSQIFDVQYPPAGIGYSVTNRHCHGVFFDRYKINSSGVPRIVGIMGDGQTRIVVSDDSGATWFDNRAALNGYAQNVCGFAIPQGYLMGTDAAEKNGVQFMHRGISEFQCEELFSVLQPTDNFTTIVYVGGNFYQRKPNSPILSVFTPEGSTQYDAGARGCAIISHDGGLTWEKIFNDTYGALTAISGALIFQNDKGHIYLKPANWAQDYGDGNGLTGRMFRITL